MKYLICTIGVAAGAFLATYSPAATVNFIDVTEGNVTIQFNANDWSAAITPGGGSGPEHASFSGAAEGNFGSGSYSIALQDSAGGPLSDWLRITWQTFTLSDRTLTSVFMEFSSDTEGQTLQLPLGFNSLSDFNVVAVENGRLQPFTVPITGMQLTVGIQSDVEGSKSVPDGGATAILLALAGASLSALRRILG